jgi:hypothetical protein
MKTNKVACELNPFLLSGGRNGESSAVWRPGGANEYWSPSPMNAVDGRFACSRHSNTAQHEGRPEGSGGDVNSLNRHLRSNIERQLRQQLRRLGKKAGCSSIRMFIARLNRLIVRVSQRTDPNKSPSAQEQVPKVMTFPPQEFQTRPANPSVPCVSGATALAHLHGATSANVIDFFDARAWLSTGFEDCRQEFETSRKTGRPATRQILSVCRGHRLDESLFWLLSATAVAYLLVAIIGL